MHGDGTPPKVTLPEQWSAKQTSTPAQPLPIYPWWQELKSEELNQFVIESLANNRQIQQTINHIEQAQAQLDTVKLSWLPSLNFLAGTVNGDTTLSVQGLSIPVNNSGGFVGFLPTYIINLLQLPTKQMQAGRLLEASQADYLAVRTAIIAQVTSAYVTVLATDRQGELLKDMQNTLTRLVALSSALNKRGLSTELAQNQLESELHGISGQLAQNIANYQAAQNALSILTGRTAGRIKTTQALAQINTNVAAPGNLPASVVATRPDVAAARARLDASNYGVTATTSLLLPTFSLNALMTNVKATNNTTNSSSNANFQAAFATWVLDPKVIGAISSSDIAYKAALINYVETVNNALRETDDALSAYEGQQLKFKYDSEALSKASANLKISESMYLQGLVSQSQFLEAKVKLDLSEAVVTQTKLMKLIALAKLYQSLGGGSIYEEQNLDIANGTVQSKHN